MEGLLSLVIIARNNPSDVDRCLVTCHSLFDEIVIIDTGIEGDKPVNETAKIYGSKIHNFAWIDDFSAARNYAFSKASTPWLMWLDSDDDIRPEHLLKLFELKEQLATSKFNSYVMTYNYGHDPYGNPNSDHLRHRIVKNIPTNRWEYPIHEILVFKSYENFEKRLDIHIEHKRHSPYQGDRNYRILKKAYEGRYKSDGRIMHYYARECFYRSYHKNVIEVYSKHLYDVPEYTRLGAYYYYMKSCFRLKKDDLAIKLCHEAIGKDPRFAEFPCELYDYYLKKEDYHEAKKWLLKVVGKSKPKDTWEVFMSDNSYNQHLIQRNLQMIEEKIKTVPHKKSLSDNSNESNVEKTKSAKVIPFHRTSPNTTEKIGRNIECPCGSGKKYKKCCGKTINPSDIIFLLPLHDSAASKEWLPKCVSSYSDTEAAEKATLYIMSNGNQEWYNEINDILKSMNLPIACQVIDCGSNLGFIGGINYGIEKLKHIKAPSYVGFLNSDITFSKGWLDDMVNELARMTAVGGVGFTHRKYNIEGKDIIGWLEFCCVLFKYKAINQVVSDNFDCLDNRFGMGYFDDDDLCLRLLLANWKLSAIAPKIVHHIRSSTPDFAKRISANYPVFTNKWKDNESKFVKYYLDEQKNFFQRCCPWVIEGN